MEKSKMTVRKPTAEEMETSAQWGTWSKSPSIFDWQYAEKETCYILEGEAEVSDREGNHVKFGPGDFVVFEEGLDCTWKIKQTIRKKYRFG
ncbi:MAG: cupin domain-containing protein [Bacteroidota bacterium]